MRTITRTLTVACLVLLMPLALASPALAAPSANHATIADLEAIVIAYVERHVEQLLGNGGIMDGTRATFEVFIAELALANVRSIVSDPERLVAFAGPLISAMLNDMLNASLAQISPRVPTIDVSALVARALALLAESELSEALLSTPLVNDMLETAVAYATADAVDYAMSQIIFIPGEADVLELGRRYASEIAGLSVIPFPLTNAFLNTSRVDQGLLLSHSRDFVNPFWTIEIHSHGFLDLQRTYRVTGWQRTVNTDSLAFLANAMPDANIDLRDFSIENYVLLRLGMDVAAGTYEGISNFDVDSFTEALPAITWAAAERAAADVIAEHSTRRER